MEETVSAGYYKSLDTFGIALSSQPAFSPPGQQLHSYTGQDGSSYHIFKVSGFLVLSPYPPYCVWKGRSE